MYYFIVNPNSYCGTGKKVWNTLKAALDAKGIKYKYFLTKYVGNGIDLANEISKLGTEENPVNIIAVGGDGTIHEVLTGIVNYKNVIFGYIPTGSGNDFCRSMKLPFDPLKALDIILSKKNLSFFDVGKITSEDYSSNFGVSVGMGYDASICHDVLTSYWKKAFNKLHIGKMIYLFYAIRRLATMSPCPMEITIDNKETIYYNKVFFTAVMNQQYEGGGFKLNPHGKSNDGKLNICVIERMSKLKFLACLPSALSGKHIIFKGVHILEGKNITLKSSIALPIHIDGESGGIQNQINISVEPTPLCIYMP